MTWDVVGSVVASLGGASAIALGFAHLLGKMWTKQIEESVSFKYKAQLEDIKLKGQVMLAEIQNKNQAAMSNFKFKADSALSAQEQFSGISQEFYQEFFKKRVEVYLLLLKWSNEYSAAMTEDFSVDISESWGSVYCGYYKELKLLVEQNQLYISNELDDLFSKIRSYVADHIKRLDENEARNGHSEDDGEQYFYVEEEICRKMGGDTWEQINAILQQIREDVRKLRSRVELDKVA